MEGKINPLTSIGICQLVSADKMLSFLSSGDNLIEVGLTLPEKRRG